MMRDRPAALPSALSLMAAPIAFLAGQITLAQWQGQVADRTWFASHIVLLGSAALYVPALHSMRGQDGGSIFAGLAEALGVLGALALFGQFVIDLAIGHVDVLQPAMAASFQRVQSFPAMRWIFYTLAPIALFTGQLVLLLRSAITRTGPRWIGIAAVAGFVGIGIAAGLGSMGMFLVGFILLELGCVYLGWRILRDRPASAGRRKMIPADERFETSSM